MQRILRVPNGFTNRVLIQQTSKETIFYLPAYLRMRIKDFTDINLDSMHSQIDLTLLLTVFYGSIDFNLVQQFSQQMILHFNRSGAIKLSKNDKQINFKINRKQQSFTYIIPKQLCIRIECDSFWTPFQIVNMILTVIVQSVCLYKDNKHCLFKFNLMDHPSNFLKMYYEQEISFGSYDLAQALMIAEYSNQKIPKQLKKQLSQKSSKISNKLIKDKDDQFQRHQNFQNNGSLEFLNSAGSIMNGLKLKEFESVEIVLETNQIKRQIFQIGLKKPTHFQYAHFILPLYKFPSTTIIMIFLPLWILGIINLGIFFQNQSLGDRIGSISALVVAFVALIPTIRSQIPPSPTITYMQVLLYLEASTTILSTIQSITIRNQKNFKQNWTADIFLILSLIITIGNIFTVLITFLLYKCIWEPGYNRTHADEDLNQVFNLKQWYNQNCDKHFVQFSSSTKTYHNASFKEEEEEEDFEDFKDEII